MRIKFSSSGSVRRRHRTLAGAIDGAEVSTQIREFGRCLPEVIDNEMPVAEATVVLNEQR